MDKIIIAIDGYSSCGKSTLARSLARALGYIYISSGDMYRAVTYYFIHYEIDFNKADEVASALSEIQIELRPGVEPGTTRTFLNEKDIEEEIRKMYVSDLVSPVAAISAVRRAMVKQQQELGRQKGIVMDGRDIGTVVFPDAGLKIFLTADVNIRAQRRYHELQAKGQEVTMKDVKNNLLERDHIDSNRSDSPLRQAEDAVVIDNTNLSLDEQLAMALALAKVRIKKAMINMA